MAALDKTVDVSIVLPVYTGWNITRECLKSLLATAETTAATAEILIADDCSTDQTATEWQKFAGGRWPIVYQRNATNLGYLRNCNAILPKAQGRYICLLNNDILVGKGWLDGLVATLERYPDVAAVAPLMLDDEGRILECGAVIHSDGSTRQIGRGASASDTRYAYLNDVDYCSAACLLLRADLFRAIGFYDERYLPSYYEDVDIALRFAERGYRMVVNPRVRITHSEGASHGKEMSSTLKSHILVNREIFYRQWKHRLHRCHYQPDGLPDGRYRCGKRKGTIVVHYPRIPTYDKDAGALRMWVLMKGLIEKGHHVVLVGTAHPEMSDYLREAQAEGIEYLRAGNPEDPQFVRMLHHIEPLAAIFCHQESERVFAPAYRYQSPKTIRIFDTVDLEFLRLARMQAVKDGVDPAKLSKNALLRLATKELESILKSDITLVVSDVEKQFLTHELHLDPARLGIVATIHEPAETVAPFDQRQNFIFLGGYNHPPNVDAVTWIAEAVWPLIRKELPDSELLVYGSDPPRAVLDLESPAQGIRVLGFVEDHRAAIAQARVMLAPVRFGAGVKGKIGESLAMGTPVVSTCFGAEGMDPDGSAIAVADDAASVARQAVDLYRDRAAWQQRSAAGTALVRARFSTQANLANLLQTITDAPALRENTSIWGLVGDLVWRQHPPTVGTFTEPADPDFNYAAALHAIIGQPEEAFLQKIYLLLLGRDMDAEGHRGFAEKLHSGATRLDAIRTIVFSEEARRRSLPTHWLPKLEELLAGGYRKALRKLWPLDDKEFVSGLFRTLLYRQPDPGGLAMHTNTLAAGALRLTVVRGIATSPEARAYGVNPVWLSDLEAEFPPDYVAALRHIWDRPDEAFLRGMFLILLQREPDPSGLAFYMNAAAHMPRSAMVRAIATSAEAIAAGLDTSWFEALEAVLPPDYLAGLRQIWDHPIDAFLNEAYTLLLGREIDSDGLAHYRAECLAGLSRRQVVTQIANSTEAQARQLSTYWLAALPADQRHDNGAHENAAPPRPGATPDPVAAAGAA